jgi:hypothetical protein
MKYGKHILIVFFLIASAIALKAENYNITENKNEAEVVVYPNPATENHILISAEKEIEKIELLNIVGQQMLMQMPEPSNSIRLELGTLKNGIYLIKITFTDETSSTKRLWIE